MLSPQKELIYCESFTQWLEDLKDRHARVIIKLRLKRLMYGLEGKCEPVGKGVFELKIYYGPGYRIYFSQESENFLLLLWGGDKATQRRDIQKSQELLVAYRRIKETQ